ncbi:MAG: Nif3-like dinuclear metal center hexameric protein [Eubacteriales bacterium]
MVTVRQLYQHLDSRIPLSLRCDWDNDGLMCCPDSEKKVEKVLLSLDVTDKTVDTAISDGYDLILTHHPLIFSPLKSLSDQTPAGRRLIRLLQNGISVLSFHTRLDAVEGGVNDVLAEQIELFDVHPFGLPGEEIGRIGSVAPASFAEFAERVKSVLGAPVLEVVDSGRRVEKVALVGGAGKDYLPAAIRLGADTYLTGEMGHHADLDAADAGINLILAGHHYTEFPVLERLRQLALECDPTLSFGTINSCPVGFL